MTVFKEKRIDYECGCSMTFGGRVYGGVSPGRGWEIHEFFDACAEHDAEREELRDVLVDEVHRKR